MSSAGAGWQCTVGGLWQSSTRVENVCIHCAGKSNTRNHKVCDRYQLNLTSAGRFCLIPTATIALSLFPGARLVSTGGFIRQADAWESIWAVSESREAFRDERVCSKLSCSRQEAFEPVGQKQPGTWHGFVASQVRYPTEAEDTCLHQI